MNTEIEPTAGVRKAAEKIQAIANKNIALQSELVGWGPIATIIEEETKAGKLENSLRRCVMLLDYSVHGQSNETENKHPFATEARALLAELKKGAA